MRQFTRTSRVAVALALLLFIGFSSASATPIVSEVGVTVGESGPTVAKQRALAGALSESVKAVVRRHLGGDEFKERRREIRGLFLKNPSRYVTRYVVLAEELLLGRLRLSIEAQVDERRVIRTLEDKGFFVNELMRLPRTLLVTGEGDRTGGLTSILVKRLRGEGILVTPNDEFIDPYLYYPPPLPEKIEGEGEESAPLVVVEEVAAPVEAPTPEVVDEEAPTQEIIEVEESIAQEGVEGEEIAPQEVEEAKEVEEEKPLPSLAALAQGKTCNITILVTADFPPEPPPPPHRKSWQPLS